MKYLPFDTKEQALGRSHEEQLAKLLKPKKFDKLSHYFWEAVQDVDLKGCLEVTDENAVKNKEKGKLKNKIIKKP